MCILISVVFLCDSNSVANEKTIIIQLQLQFESLCSKYLWVHPTVIFIIRPDTLFAGYLKQIRSVFQTDAGYSIHIIGNLVIYNMSQVVFFMQRMLSRNLFWLCSKLLHFFQYDKLYNKFFKYYIFLSSFFPNVYKFQAKKSSSRWTGDMILSLSGPPQVHPC